MVYQETINYLLPRINIKPLCAIILGTGLGKLADQVENPTEIEYPSIPGFVRSTAPSHHGTLIIGTISQTPVLVFKGRFHYYEGYSMEQVVYPVRIARLLGAKYLLVTNAAGSLNINFQPGQLVRLSDHINMFGTNPLIGANILTPSITITTEKNCSPSEINEFGERFPSLHAAYDPELAQIANEVAHNFHISLPSGVYCGVSGPSLETRAECVMIKNWGADLVGMSTVPEVITAVHCGLRVLAVSVVTNLSNIFHSAPHRQEEIRANADRASTDLMLLIQKFLEKIQ